jgi:PAS domain S-box-containing protein
VNRIEYPEGDKTVCVEIREISDRKHAERNLRISEEKFSKAFRAGPDAIVISTLDDGRILDVNYNFIRMTGFARGESVGRTSVDLGIWLNPKERDQMVELVKRDGEVRDLEVRFSLKSGEVRNFQMSAHTIELEGATCLISISARCHREESPGRAAPAGAENGSGGPARGRRGARFQQFTRRDSGIQ